MTKTFSFPACAARTAFAALSALAVAVTLALAPLSVAHAAEQPSTHKISGAKAAQLSKEITIWRNPDCGCCETYAKYLAAKGYRVTRIDERSFDKRSIDVGIPAQAIGCHLAQIDGYYVSGLVPTEIIERLLTERPKIDGITLPGMPDNAPGMASKKTGTLKIYAFGGGNDGVSVYSNE